MSNRYRFAAPAFGLAALGLVTATGLTLTQPAPLGFDTAVVELPETGRAEPFGRGHVRGARPAAEVDLRRVLEVPGDADGLISTHPRKLGRGEPATMGTVDLAGLDLAAMQSPRGARPGRN